MLMSMGCDDDESSFYDETLAISEPVILNRHLVALDQTREQAWLIETDQGRLSSTTLPLNPPHWVTARSADGSQIAILAPESHMLTLITPGSEPQTYDVENAYNVVNLSEDGRFAIVWYQNVNRDSEDFFNPNAYAIIDLESGGVTQRTLRSFGDAPLNILFVPPIQFEGSETSARYALFLFDSYVTFADLGEGQYEVTAQLKLDATSPSVIPRQVIFSDWTEGGAEVGRFVYLTALGSNDIYALHLLEHTDDSGEVRLKPNINQLPSGVQPEQLLRYRGPDNREKLLVVNSGDQTLSVVDASTASVLQIPLNTAADHIYSYLSPTGEELALIYSKSGQSSIVTFARLSALEERRGQALTQLELESPINQLIDSPLEGQAIAFHSNSSGLSLINLSQAFANPLRSNLGLQSWVIDRQNAAIYASVQGSSKLAMIQLETAQISSVDVKHTIQQLTLIPQTETLILTHSGVEGNCTVMNVQDLTYEASSFYGGIYLEGALK